MYSNALPRSGCRLSWGGSTLHLIYDVEHGALYPGQYRGSRRTWRSRFISRTHLNAIDCRLSFPTRQKEIDHGEPHGLASPAIWSPIPRPDFTGLARPSHECRGLWRFAFTRLFWLSAAPVPQAKWNGVKLTGLIEAALLKRGRRYSVEWTTPSACHALNETPGPLQPIPRLST